MRSHTIGALCEYHWTGERCRRERDRDWHEWDKRSRFKDRWRNRVVPLRRETKTSISRGECSVPRYVCDCSSRVIRESFRASRVRLPLSLASGSKNLYSELRLKVTPQRELTRYPEKKITSRAIYSIKILLMYRHILVLKKKRGSRYNLGLQTNLSFRHCIGSHSLPQPRSISLFLSLSFRRIDIPVAPRRSFNRKMCQLHSGLGTKIWRNSFKI